MSFPFWSLRRHIIKFYSSRSVFIRSLYSSRIILLFFVPTNDFTTFSMAYSNLFASINSLIEHSALRFEFDMISKGFLNLSRFVTYASCKKETDNNQIIAICLKYNQ